MYLFIFAAICKTWLSCDGVLYFHVGLVRFWHGTEIKMNYYVVVVVIANLNRS